MDRYEVVEGSSSKFWEVSVRGKHVKVTWGRIGSAGQSKVITLPTAAEAAKRQASLVRQKTSKGYVLCGTAAVRPTERSASKAAKAKGPNGKAAKSPRILTPAKPKSKSPELKPRARLRAVFAELNAQGIVALQNAGYTQSDGWEDVNDIARKMIASGNRPRAGVFYHRQDLARGKRGEGLFLTFASYAKRRADADSVAVGHLIVDLLKAHGFTPKWDGKFTTRIHTGPFEWR